MPSNTASGDVPLDERLADRVLAGRYRVVDIVAVGANTIIANAFDMEFDRPVTFKIVQPELAESEGFRREFRRRAEVATALTHPNIAAVHDWGEIDIDGTSTVFWVVEYLSGGSLRDLFDRGRLLEPSQALVVGLEACRALDAAHQRGLAHTELSPSKLVFGADKRLRIIDFGMAELLGRSAWQDPSNVSTHVALYASPEQALGLDVGPKTDVYALALSMLEAVTGSVPFASDSTVATLNARVGKLLPVSADLGSLAAVLERAGRPEADDRTTAAEFGRALVQAAERLPRPEPIPLVESSLFDTAGMVRPTVAPDEPIAAAAASAVVADPVDEVAVAESVDEAAVDEAAVDEAGVIDDDVTVEPAEPAGPDDEAVTLDEAAPDSVPDITTDAVVAGAAPIIMLGGDTASDTALPDDADAFELADEVASTASTPAAPVTSTAPETPTTQQMPATALVTEPVSVTAAAAATPTATAQLADEPGVPAPYDEERPRRRTGAIVGLSLFVLAGLAALAFAGFLLLRTKSYEVPQLEGVARATALNEIAGNDWDVVEADPERSDEYPVPGTVIRTFPEAGATLEEGEEFRLFVSSGPEFRDLPDVVGLTVDAAMAELDELQLSSFVIDKVFDEDAAVDSVLTQVVEGDASRVPGDPVLPGTNIALTLSQGPAPRVVPNVTGGSFDDAVAAGEAIRLAVVAGEEVFSDDVPVGVIVSQDPAPDTELERDGTITVQVSKGLDLIALPDIEGLSFTEAQQALTDAGFTIGSLLGTTEGTFESISISADTVDDTGLYRRGTSVDLIFL